LELPCAGELIGYENLPLVILGVAMYLEVIEEYPEFRGKLLRVFARCIGLRFEHILFVNIIEEEGDNAKSND
jgi:hypothetical protein